MGNTFGMSAISVALPTEPPTGGFWENPQNMYGIGGGISGSEPLHHSCRIIWYDLHRRYPWQSNSFILNKYKTELKNYAKENTFLKKNLILIKFNIKVVPDS